MNAQPTHHIISTRRFPRLSRLLTTTSELHGRLEFSLKTTSNLDDESESRIAKFNG
jgi:hypothetical protein